MSDNTGPGDLMTTAEVASLTRVAPATLRYWRMLKTRGPKSFTVGARRVLYKRSDVEAWLQSEYEAE